jgi:type IV pilus assembly protein PilQ
MIYRRSIALLALAALISSSAIAGTPVTAGSADSGDSRLGPGRQAFTLTSLRHETVGAVTRILVESNSPPLYTVLRPTDRLIIVDLPGGEGSRLSPEYSVKSALVDAITVRQARDDDREPPRSMTRLEISVRGEVRDRSTVSGNLLVIELSPVHVGLTPVSSPPGQKESASDAPLVARATSSGSRDEAAKKPAENKPGVYVNPKPVAGSRPVAAKPASLVTSVRADSTSGNTRVVIQTDGVAQFKDFTLTNPNRIIVDVIGVRSSVPNRVIEVGATPVERVRVGQPGANVLRVVIDSKGVVPYRVDRNDDSLVVVVGESESANAAKKAGSEQRTAASPAASNSQSHNQSVTAAANNPADSQANLLAAQRSQRPSQPSAGTPPQSSARTTTASSQPASQPKTVATTGGSATPRPAAQRRPELAFCDPGYVGGPISFDLRAGVDIRDMLRFVSQQYGINFIVDKSVGQVPVDIRVTEIPWNQAIESVLRANRLGAVCESEGKIIRIATLSAIKEERDQQKAIEDARRDAGPLVTKIKHLRYARALGSLGATGGGGSGRGGSIGGRSGGGGGGSSFGGVGGGGAQQTGSLLKIIDSRLSKRGKIEVDARTNSLIITDVPENVEAIEEMIAILDKPEPQVEIEARIVIANRSFLRDLGVELGAAGINSHSGMTGFFQTSPLRLSGTGVTPGGQQGSGGGGGGGGGGGSDQDENQIGPNLAGGFATGALRAGSPSSVLALTTGLLGTSIISTTLSAQERKGQIKTIATPRITAQDNQTAEIVNGVQIPIQTVSNNTITTTFVTAALRLEITPQIVEDTGEVLMHVVAENNSVNTAIAQALNSGIPGIDTQSAESTVRVQDGGTTVMGGITVDREAYSSNRTPGVSRIPILGNLFKRKTTERTSDEILFFLTPRIVRQDGSLAPPSTTPQRSSAAPGTPNPTSTQRAATQQPQPAVPVATAPNPPVTVGAGATGGQAKK